MIDAIVLAVAAAATAVLALSPRLRRSEDWHATVTPLASIMGSGFLVCVPLLAGAVGGLAPAFMIALLALAFAVGGVIRFNIRHFEPIEHDEGRAQTIAFLSRIALAAAYLISVVYYLQLLAAFALGIAGVKDPTAAHALSTALLAAIGLIGAWRGLGMLEAVERWAVSLNLGMICALLVALVIHDGGAAMAGTLSLPGIPTIDLADCRVVLGLLIIVQGFETSRYLGDEHAADVRIRTMRRAQLVSSGIYVAFVTLAIVLYRDGLGTDVTAIIEMTHPAAAVLPLLITIAAVGSQFSAAVADNAGAGGLIEDITNRKVPLRLAYLFIALVTIGITWETDVNEIIAYASRAFALFYALQCVVAWLVVRSDPTLPRRALRLVGFALLAVACLAVFALGAPAG